MSRRKASCAPALSALLPPPPAPTGRGEKQTLSRRSAPRGSRPGSLFIPLPRIASSPQRAPLGCGEVRAPLAGNLASPHSCCTHGGGGVAAGPVDLGAGSGPPFPPRAEPGPPTCSLSQAAELNRESRPSNLASAL